MGNKMPLNIFKILFPRPKLEQLAIHKRKSIVLQVYKNKLHSGVGSVTIEHNVKQKNSIFL